MIVDLHVNLEGRDGALADAAMMFVSDPIVDHSRAPSVDSIVTRVRAPVAAPESTIRTL